MSEAFSLVGFDPESCRFVLKGWYVFATLAKFDVVGVYVSLSVDTTARGLINRSHDGDHSGIRAEKSFCLCFSCGHDIVCDRANIAIETPVSLFPGANEENPSENGREVYDDSKSQIQI